MYACATPVESDDVRAAARIVPEREISQTRPMSRRENRLYQRDVLSGFARGSCYSSRLRLLLSTRGNCLITSRVSTHEKKLARSGLSFFLVVSTRHRNSLFVIIARKILILKSSEAKREFSFSSTKMRIREILFLSCVISYSVLFIISSNRKKNVEGISRPHLLPLSFEFFSIEFPTTLLH